MRKKFLAILPIIIFVLVILWGNFSLAISAPTNPSYNIVETTYDYIAIEFSWDKVGDTGVGWYHLVYYCVENCSGGNATWVIQPTSPGRVSKLFIGGFEFSGPTTTVKYAWQVGACSSQESGACVYSSAQEFTTPRQPAPSPSDGGNGGNGGDGGDGGSPVGLINPLQATTLWEAINALINFLLLLAFTIAPLLIIYAAFLILSSAGRAEQIQKGKNIILWTLIALTIILLAKGLPSIIKGALGG